jgi:hypothetical protein
VKLSKPLLDIRPSATEGGFLACRAKPLIGSPYFSLKTPLETLSDALSPTPTDVVAAASAISKVFHSSSVAALSDRAAAQTAVICNNDTVLAPRRSRTGT